MWTAPSRDAKARSNPWWRRRDVTRRLAETGGSLVQSAVGSRVGATVSSLSFRIVFALRMVIFLYRGVPTILFIWLLLTFSRSTRQTTAPGVYLSSSTPGLIGRLSRILRSSSSFHSNRT